jgi:hypothetical protein
VVSDNLVRANNDPDVPGADNLDRFIGAGILVAGGRHDTIVHNTVSDQGSYGIALVIYPWLGKPPEQDHCQGGRDVVPDQVCVFNAYGNLVANNSVSGNGGFGNPTNGDLADGTLAGDAPDCFSGNTAPGGAAPTLWPAGLQRPGSACPGSVSGTAFGPFILQTACASRAFGACDGTVGPVLPLIRRLATVLHADLSALDGPNIAASPARYPTSARATAPYPPAQPSMADPCAGVPTNAWCTAGGA